MITAVLSLHSVLDRAALILLLVNSHTLALVLLLALQFLVDASFLGIRLALATHFLSLALLMLLVFPVLFLRATDAFLQLLLLLVLHPLQFLLLCLTLADFLA